MSLKERLRGIVAAVATAALAFSVAPVTAMAAAPALELGTATISGLGADVDNVELYQIATITNGSDNVLVTEANDAYASILARTARTSPKLTRRQLPPRLRLSLLVRPPIASRTATAPLRKAPLRLMTLMLVSTS